MHILLVEPDVILAQTYLSALRRANHTVSHARGAQEAVQLADDKLPDVMLLEPQLARHNGIELLYELRSYTEWQNIPVILLTQLSPSALQANSLLADHLDVSHILSKSQTSLEQLVSIVDNIGKGK